VQITGTPIPVPDSVQSIMQATKKSVLIKPDFLDVKEYLLSR
jgi:hypothetical protein